jgi:hypothetical protein
MLIIHIVDAFLLWSCRNRERKKERKLSIFWFYYNLRPQEKIGIRTPPAAATDNASAQSGRCESVA